MIRRTELALTTVLAFAVLLSVCLFVTPSGAQIHDPEFGEDGKVFPAFTFSDRYQEGIAGIAEGADGRVVVGSPTLQIESYLADGTIDPEFGPDAEPVRAGNRFDHIPNLQGIGVQSDGKIVLGGWLSGSNQPYVFGYFILRLDPDGRIDKTFGRNGVIRSEMLPRSGATVRDLTIDERDRIVVAGQASDTAAMVTRFTDNGGKDRSFGRRGVIRIKARKTRNMTTMNSVEVLENGKILAAGTIDSRPSVFRFRKDGSRDRSFGESGRVRGLPADETSCAGNAALCADGELAVHESGSFVLSVANLEGSPYLLGFRDDGRRNQSFGRHGVVRLGFDAIEPGLGEIRPKRGSGATPDAMAPIAGGQTFLLAEISLKDGYRVVGLTITKNGSIKRAQKGEVFVARAADEPMTGSAVGSGPRRVYVGAWSENPASDPPDTVRPALFRLDAG